MDELEQARCERVAQKERHALEAKNLRRRIRALEKRKARGTLSKPTEQIDLELEQHMAKRPDHVSPEAWADLFKKQRLAQARKAMKSLTDAPRSG
jgi:hypothetical protein